MVAHPARSQNRLRVRGFMFLLGASIGALFATQLVTGLFGGDPTGLMRVSAQDAPIVERQIGRAPVVAAGDGHDGYFFFQLANDPLLTDSAVLASFDDPVHRASRLVYPALAGAGGLVPASWIPSALIIINVLGVGAGTALTAELSRSLGASTAFGLLFTVNLGLLFAISIDGSSVVATATLIGALLSLRMERYGLALLGFAIAILTRESYAVFALGALAWHFRRDTRTLMRSSVTVLAPYGVVRVGYEWLFRSQPASEAATSRNFGRPLQGVIDSAATWAGAGGLELLALVLVGVSSVGLVVLCLVKPTTLSVAGAVVVPIAMFFTDDILAEAYDLSRVLAPLMILFPLALLSSIRDRSDEPLTASP